MNERHAGFYVGRYRTTHSYIAGLHVGTARLASFPYQPVNLPSAVYTSSLADKSSRPALGGKAAGYEG